MSKTIYRLFLILLLTGSLTSCDEIFPSAEDLNDIDLLANTEPVENIKVTDVNFTPDYKKFVVTADVVGYVGPYSFTDTTHIRMQVHETIDGIKHADNSTPKLTKVVNVEAERYRDNKVAMLALIDRSLPQVTLDDIKDKIIGCSNIFKYDNLFLAFIDSSQVSETIRCTPYVLKNYFKHTGSNYAYLYRSMLQKRQEMKQQTGLWQGFRYCSMVVFSNDQVYIQDEPIDPDHYELEAQMVSADSLAPANISISYATMVNEDKKGLANSYNILRLFCAKNNGTYIEHFSTTKLRSILLSTFHMKFPANQFHFVNPDLKVFRGNDHVLHLKIFDKEKDSLVASFSTNILLGTLDNPVVVNEYSKLRILAQGIILSGILLLIIYVLLQFIVPYIRYKLFLKRYVITYKGPNMSNRQTLVAESCYFCKAPFEVGDQIVTKCKHTVHKECWDENNYHCPEYSDRCKTGSHYYNEQNLLDAHNATFYLRWILMAIVAATMAWAMQLLLNTIYEIIGYNLAEQLTTTGLFVGLFLTMGLSLLSTHRVYNKIHIGETLLRAGLAGAGCFLAFYLTNRVTDILNLRNYLLIDWIPWTLSGFIIALCATWHTPIRLHKIKLWLGILVGILSTYIWLGIYIYHQFSFRVLILFSFIFFAIGLSLSIAMIAPRSERYFLKVQGAIKELDIALYKWFRNRREAIFTIGRSVDCSLQLSWDINSDVAPLQAQIEMIDNIPYLTAIEDGVYVKDKPLEVGQKARLYHGRSFTIGKTTFTYLEKDS